MEGRNLLAVDVLLPISDGFATDTNKDGTFPDLNATAADIRVRDYPNTVGYPGDDRGVLEFDMSHIGAGLTVDSAEFGFQKNAGYGGNATVDIFVYAADGVLTPSDATAASTLAGTVVLTSASSYSVSLDTSALQAVYDTSNHVGILLAVAANSSGFGYGMYSTEGTPQSFPQYTPRLTLTTSGAAVPSLAVSLNPASIAENAGASAVTGIVERLNADTTAPLIVTLSTSDATEAIPTQASVTIPAGSATAEFNLDILDDTLLDGIQPVAIAATAAGFVDGDASILVTDHELLTVTAADSSVVESAGAGATTITVTRHNTDIASPLTVTLSDTSARLSVPVTATILANETSVTVPVDVVDTDIVDGNASVLVKANAAGYPQAQTTIVVLDDDGGKIRSGNILVAIDNRYVQEYKPDGTLIQTFFVNPRDRTVSGQFRDVVVNDSGDIEVINSTSWLSNIDVETKTVTDHTAPDWSTGGNLTAGGVARLGQYLYVNDVGTTRGVIRFDTLNGYATTRADTAFDIHDVSIGLDGKLYALESGGSGDDVAVIDPLTMQVLGNIKLQFTTHRGIAVNAAGEIFATGWQESLYKYDGQGNLIDFLATGFQLDDIDIDSTGRIIAAGDAPSLSHKYVVITDERLQTLTTFPVTDDLELFVGFADPDATAVTPVVTPSGVSATLTENGSSSAGSSVIIDPGLTLSDDGNVMTGAVVRITGNYVKGQDSLAAFSQNGILAKPFDSKTGTIKLSGTATVADYQNALRSVRYSNSSNSPDTSPRTITFSAIDEGWAGSGDATVLVVSINDGPPVGNDDSHTIGQDDVLQIAPVETNRLTLQSDTGEYVGQGQNYTLNGLLTIGQQYGTQGAWFRFDNGSSDWNLTFRSAAGPLAVGSYPVATRLGGNGTATLNISGNGRGSGRHFGSFDVHEVEFDASGTLIRFAASFVQYTESKSAALRGTIDYHSTYANKSGVLVNDTDTDGGRLSVTEATSPEHGTLVMNPNGTFRYTPATGFFGSDAFEYTLRDSDGATTTATVTVNVLPSPGITVTGSPLVIRETGMTDTFDVVLNVQPASDVVLTVTSGDTSEASADKATLTFTPANWNVAQTVTVTGVDDSVVDGDQAGIVTIAVDDGASDDQFDSVADVLVNFTNTDNDTGIISFGAAMSSASEGDATHDVSVRLSLATGVTLSAPVSVEVSDVAGGTAATPADYVFASQTVTFLPGDGDGTVKWVSLTIADDPHVEGDDTIEIDLHNLVDGTNGQVSIAASSEHTVTILDDDVATISFATSASSIGETAGGHAVSVEIAIPSGGSLLRSISVDVEMAAPSAGTATDGLDYNFSSETVTFYVSPFQTTKTVTIGILPDSLHEGNETIHLRLANLSPPTGALVSLAAPTAHTVTIEDDDTAGISVSAINGNTTESGTTATFSVVLDSEPTDDVTIGLSSSDTTEGAVSPASLTFTAANWNVSRQVTVTGVDDLLIDGDITFSIVLAAAVSDDRRYEGLDPADVSVTNEDNDAPIVFSYFPISGSLVDGGTSYSAGQEPNAEPFRAAALRAIDGDAQGIQEGEALVGGGKKPKTTSALDYYQWSFGTVESATSFHLTAWRDANSEGDDFRVEYSLSGGPWIELATVANATSQTFDVDLSSTPLNGQVLLRVFDTNRSPTSGRRSPTLETIHVDSVSFDSVITDLRPRVDITATDDSAGEFPVDGGQFTLTREGTTGNLEVYYTVTGSATAGTDYVALTGTATIPDGQSSTAITVTPLDDSDPEGDETITVTLVADSSHGYKVGSSGSATVTLTDNDLRIFTATGEETVDGSVVANSHTATSDADGVVETIEERQSGGKKSNRTSYMEHRWTFIGVSGAESFYLTASRPDNSEGESFVFQFSTDGGANWTLLATVSTPSLTLYPVALPSTVSGTVVVRVVDSDPDTAGNGERDTVDIDQMYFSTAPVAPLVADSAASVAGGNLLTSAELDGAWQQALAYWQHQEPYSPPGVFPPVSIEIAQLATPYLGLAYPAENRIQIDIDAAGFGWTPSDLLSTLIHEIGHLYGHDHNEMGDSLVIGSRLTVVPSESFVLSDDDDWYRESGLIEWRSLGNDSEFEGPQTPRGIVWSRFEPASDPRQWRLVGRRWNRSEAERIDKLFAESEASREHLDHDLLELLAELSVSP